MASMAEVLKSQSYQLFKGGTLFKKSMAEVWQITKSMADSY